MEYIIQDKQQYKQYQEAFRTLARSKKATVQDHILYNLIRGKDLKRGFTPITNTNKLQSSCNGDPFYAFSVAKSDLRHTIANRSVQRDSYEKFGKKYDWEKPFCDREPYAGLFTEEQWDLLAQALK